MIPKLNPIVSDIPEALSIFINQIVYNKKARGEKVYTYSLGEAFFDIPRFKIPDQQFQTGYHYSGSLGQPKLRQKIANLYIKQYNVPVNFENEILISAGSKIIIYMVMQTVLSQGDEVLIPEPAWLSYKEQVKLAGGHHIPIPYSKNIDEWENYITPKTKLIIINNPNNPSGQLYTQKDLKKLLFLAQKYNLFVLSDEAYSDFLCPEDKFISFANIDFTKENSIIVNSLSKNMGMSGWRVGYAIAHIKIIQQLLKINQHLITCAATILQDYMADHFEELLSYTLPQAIQMAQKRKQVECILKKIGIKSLRGAGTFYFLLDVSGFKGTTDELVYELLFNYNIATVPGIAYGESTKDFIRFGIGTESLEDIEQSLKTIKKLLDMPTYDNSKIKKMMKKEGIL